MTDRAKKISELQTTSSVANTDKIVVLKDAANTTAASTRAMTINAFSYSVGPLIRMDLPGSEMSVGNVTLNSNNGNATPFLTVANCKAYEVFYFAQDLSASADKSIGHLFVTANSTSVDAYNQATSSVGNNTISFDIPGTINAVANTTTLYFSRQSATSANVLIKYSLVKYF